MSRRTIFILTGFLGLGIGLYFGKSHGPLSPQPPELPVLTAQQKATYKRGQPYTTSPYWQTLSQMSLPKAMKERRDLVRPIFAEWAKQDAAQAFDAAMNMPETRNHPVVLMQILTHLIAQEGMAATVARVEALTNTERLEEAREDLGYQISESENPKEYMEALLANYPKGTDGTALGMAIHSWRSKATLEEVSTWLEAHREHMDEATMAKCERGAIGQEMGRLDHPAETAAWLMQRATDDSRSEHLLFIIQRWADQAPNAAAKWLETQPKGPQNDAAIAQLVYSIEIHDAESASHWALTISDPKKRLTALDSATSAWHKTDPAAAAAFRAPYFTDPPIRIAPP